MSRFHTVILAAAVVLVLAPITAAQTDSKRKDLKRPSLSLKVTPGTGMVPVRMSATAEFKGGDDDYQDYYCPTIEWIWGDGTISESSNDCDPYEAGVSQIRRRYTQSHMFKRAGTFRVTFRLKNRDKVLTSQSTVVRLIGGGF